MFSGETHCETSAWKFHQNDFEGGGLG